MNAELSAPRKAAGTPMIAVCKQIGRTLAAALARVEIIGADNVPATGPVLLAANHTHNVDGPLLFALSPRPTSFLVKAEAFVGPVRPFLLHIGQIPIRRGTVERAPLAAALDALTAGGAVGVFPEGSRGNGEVSKVEHGIAYLALRSGAPVVPIACSGTPAMLARRTARRPPVRIVIGPALPVTAGPASRQAVAQTAEQIREALAKLVVDLGPAEESR